MKTPRKFPAGSVAKTFRSEPFWFCQTDGNSAGCAHDVATEATNRKKAVRMRYISIFPRRGGSWRSGWCLDNAICPAAMSKALYTTFPPFCNYGNSVRLKCSSVRGAAQGESRTSAKWLESLLWRADAV